MYGILYGMQKTTIYLGEELKSAVEREARIQGVSEAQVIRNAVSKAVERPLPRPGIIQGEPMADRVDELLDGFGSS